MSKLQPLRCDGCDGLIYKHTMICQMRGTVYKGVASESNRRR